MQPRCSLDALAPTVEQFQCLARRQLIQRQASEFLDDRVRRRGEQVGLLGSRGCQRRAVGRLALALVDFLLFEARQLLAGPGNHRLRHPGPGHEDLQELGAEEDGDDETARHMRQQLNDLIKEIPRAKK